MNLWESQTLVWPQAGKTLNTKTAKFCSIRYIPRLKKDQELNIAEAGYQIFIYIVSKLQLQIRYIMGDMIPPSYGSSLFQNSSLNRTPVENFYSLGYRGPNGIYEAVPKRARNLISMVWISYPEDEIVTRGSPYNFTVLNSPVTGHLGKMIINPNWWNQFWWNLWCWNIDI